MKQFKCEICGGTSIIQIDEKTYECQDCGLQYDVAEVETLIVLPQEVVEEPAELTVEEQENSQQTFDVPQELEDNFTEEIYAEQETEEIAVETDSKTSPEYIEDTSIASAEDVETDNSTAIEEKPQSEATEEEADVKSIVEPEIEEAEDVVSEDGDKSEETEVDEQEETVESSAIIPWYKNKKIIIPSIAGIALALVAVILLIILLPKGNVPVSDDNSSDIKGTIESSQVENTINSSTCESSVESNSSKNESINSSQTTTNTKPQKHNTTVQDGEFGWSTIDLPDGTISIMGAWVNGNAKYPSELEFPTTYNGKKVTQIDGFAFSGTIYGPPESKASVVSLPSNILNIGDNAFSESDFITVNINSKMTGNFTFSRCPLLKNVNFGSNITTIGEYSFNNCDAIESISLPNNITRIADGAFSDCKSLTKVEIGSGITDFGNAFLTLPKLKTITFKEGLKTVAGFRGCSSLSNVTLPNSVERIEDSSFSDNDSLTEVTVGGNITYWGGGAFAWCDNLKKVTLKEGITTIGNSAFIGCTSLESIEIPSSVINIEYAAFNQCTSLKTVYFHSQSQIDKFKSNFDYRNGLENVELKLLP